MMMISCLHSLLIPLELHTYLYDTHTHTHARVCVCVYMYHESTYTEIFQNDIRMWTKSLTYNIWK